jgi:hypothetical protein
MGTVLLTTNGRRPDRHFRRRLFHCRGDLPRRGRPRDTRRIQTRARRKPGEYVRRPDSSHPKGQAAVSGTASTFQHPSLAEIDMNQRNSSTLGYIGVVAAAVLAAGLSSGNALAAGPGNAAQAGPFEGGQSANTFATAPFMSSVDRATVSAEAREAARHLDSRSGYQSGSEQGAHTQLASTLSRAQVREEAMAASRDAGTQVFEGGQAGTIVTRMARPSATIAGSPTVAAH